MVSSAVVRVTIVTLGAKVMVSPGAASAMAWRSEPGPKSAPLLTAYAAAITFGIGRPTLVNTHDSASIPMSSTRNHLAIVAPLAVLFASQMCQLCDQPRLRRYGPMVWVGGVL